MRFVLCLISVNPGSTLFPYTTLFRSFLAEGAAGMQQISFADNVRTVLNEKPELYSGVALSDGEANRFEVFVGPKRSEEHTSELQSRRALVCRLLLEKKNIYTSSLLPP